MSSKCVQVPLVFDKLSRKRYEVLERSGRLQDNHVYIISNDIHVRESDISLGYSPETREIVIDTPNVTRKITLDENQYSDYTRFRVGTNPYVSLQYSGNTYEIYDFQTSSYTYFFPTPKNNRTSYATIVMHYEDVETVPEIKWSVLNSDKIIKWSSIDGDIPTSGKKCMYQIELIPNDISSYTGIMAVKNLTSEDSEVDYSNVGYYDDSFVSHVENEDSYYGYQKINAGHEESINVSENRTLYEISDFQTSSYNYYLPSPLSIEVSELLLIQHYENLSSVPQINWIASNSDNVIKWNSIDGDSVETGNKYMYSIQILPNDTSSYSGIMAIKKLNQ